MADFEFTEEDNRTFNALSRKMHRVTIIWYIIAALLFIETNIELFAFGTMKSPKNEATITGAILVAIALTIGYYFYRPIDNFKKIISTKGRDIKELMIAIEDLSEVFDVLRVFMLLYAFFEAVRTFLYVSS